MNGNVEVLEEVLEVLNEEKNKLCNLADQNKFRIEEINSYLKELSKEEDEDFKVFSPRNVENLHRKQIEADTTEKKKYEDENAEYNKKIEFLKALIDKVNIVIDNLQFEQEKIVEPEKVSEDTEKNNEQDVKQTETFDQDKRHIAHQILNCVSFIDPDPERAKRELTAISKKLMQ